MVGTGNHIRFAGLLGLFAALDGSAWATSLRSYDLSELEQFVRCHTTFTGTHPGRRDPQLLAVRAGTKTGRQACMELFESGRFAPGTQELSNEQQKKDSKITGMLKTFNRFHNSFFKRNDTIPLDDSGRPSSNLREQELGQYFTRALFMRDKPLRDVLSEDGSIEPKRVGGVSTRFNNPGAYYIQGNFTFSLDVVTANGRRERTTWNPTQVTNGELIGFQSTQPQTIPALSTAFGSVRPELGPTDVNQAFGPGILGDNRFVALNSDAAFMGVFNGGLKVARRYADAVFSSLLCRELPVIRITDVPESAVDTASPLPFKKQTSCMQCHYSMDPMAGVVRHAMATRSSILNDTPTSFATFHVVSNDGLPQRPQNEYRFQSPSGDLRYRDLDGNLVNLHLARGVTDLAEALAGSKDFYACVAKRYYQFLTGIDVPIYDFTDPKAPQLSVEDQSEITRVLGLGESLRNHQSLRQLIDEILATPAFRRRP